MRNWLVAWVSLIGIAALITSPIAVDVHGAQDTKDQYAKGDQWVYNTTLKYDVMSLKGTITYSFDEKSVKTINGTTFQTYDIASKGVLKGTGTSGPSTITVKATIDEVQSVDVATLDLIFDDSNLTMETTVQSMSAGLTRMLTWVHNETSYSPSGGIGQPPSDISVGTSWSLTYTAGSRKTSYLDGDRTDEWSNYSVKYNYTYLGAGVMKVPAGSFMCNETSRSDGTTNELQWYNDEVGSFVKSEVFEGFDKVSVMELVSFKRGTDSSDLGNTMLIVAAGIGAASVVTALVVWRFVQRRAPPAAPSSIHSQEEEGPLTPRQ